MLSPAEAEAVLVERVAVGASTPPLAAVHSAAREVAEQFPEAATQVVAHSEEIEQLNTLHASNMAFLAK